MPRASARKTAGGAAWPPPAARASNPIAYSARLAQAVLSPPPPRRSPPPGRGRRGRASVASLALLGSKTLGRLQRRGEGRVRRRARISRGPRPPAARHAAFSRGSKGARRGTRECVAAPPAVQGGGQGASGALRGGGAAARGPRPRGARARPGRPRWGLGGGRSQGARRGARVRRARARAHARGSAVAGQGCGCRQLGSRGTQGVRARPGGLVFGTFPAGEAAGRGRLGGPPPRGARRQKSIRIPERAAAGEFSACWHDQCFCRGARGPARGPPRAARRAPAGAWARARVLGGRRRPRPRVAGAPTAWQAKPGRAGRLVSMAQAVESSARAAESNPAPAANSGPGRRIGAGRPGPARPAASGGRPAGLSFCWVLWVRMRVGAARGENRAQRMLGARAGKIAAARAPGGHAPGGAGRERAAGIHPASGLRGAAGGREGPGARGTPQAIPSRGARPWAL